MIPLVFAAASLAGPLGDIADQWKQTGAGDVRIQTGSSAALSRQIREGASPDVFIPASPDWLTEVPVLQQFDWLTNRLVYVVPSGRSASLLELGKSESLVLANEQAPAGRYARQALERFHAFPPRRIVYAADARDVVAKVAQGAASAGIAYETDARAEPRVAVAYLFPEESHDKIVYAAALLSERGRTFFEFLRGESANAAVISRGFSVIPWTPSPSR